MKALLAGSGVRRGCAIGASILPNIMVPKSKDVAVVSEPYTLTPPPNDVGNHSGLHVIQLVPAHPP